MPVYLQSQSFVPADTGSGSVGRPGLVSASGERLATLETLFEFFIDAVQNPDKAIAADPNFIEKLMRHPWVSACMNIREQKVASMLTKVDLPEEPQNKELSEAARAYTARIWSAIQNKDALFQQCEQAVLAGGIGHEWTWRKWPDGTQRPVSFLPVNGDRFQFDRQGNMAIKTRNAMVWGAHVGLNVVKPGQPQSNLPIGKFTYHVYEQAPGSWNRPTDEGYIYYGRGEDEDLYDTVVRDCAAWLLEMQWLRQYGNPPWILNRPQGDQWNAWANQICDHILSRRVVQVVAAEDAARKLFELTMPNVPSPSFDAFGKSRERNQNNIEAILLGSVGVLSQQDKGGYASHKSRQDAGPDMLARRDATRISATLSSQWVPAVLKYGPPEFAQLMPEDYPRIMLYSEDDVEPDTIKAAAELVPVPKSFVYKAMRIPKPEIDKETNQMEETIFTGQQTSPFDNLDDLNAGKNPAESGDEPRQPIGEGDDKEAEVRTGKAPEMPGMQGKA